MSDNKYKCIFFSISDKTYIQAWELFAHWHIYVPVKFTARPKIYPVHPKTLSKKKRKIRNCLCASFHFGIGQLVLVVSVNPLASESTLFLGMHSVVLDQPLWFLNTQYQCDAAFMSKLTLLTEPTSFNVMAAFAMKILGRGWILSGFSSKSENFSQTVPRLQAVDLHRLLAHVLTLGGDSENL